MQRLKLFGGLSIESESGPLTGRAVQRRRLALLALLASAPAVGTSREKLIAFLWPDADAESGRRFLSDSIYRINQALGGDVIVAAGDELRLDQHRLLSDVAERHQALESRDYERAVALFAGPFLDGFFLSDAPEFERWVDAERERHGRDHGRSLEALAELAAQTGDSARAASWWRRLAAVDPLNSRVALRLMQSLDAAGERAAAIQHARIHSALLENEVGISSNPEIVAFAERLRQTTDQRPMSAAQGVVTSQKGSLTPVVAMDREPMTSGENELGRVSFFRPVWWVVPIVVVAAIVTFWFARHDAARGTESPTRSIAVLPFANLSPSRDDEFFSDGITEELISTLAKVSGIAVASRTSSFAYKNHAADVRDVGRSLGVATVVEGSVRRSGETFRVTARLVDASTGRPIWSDAYDRRTADILAVQEELSRAIVSKLTGTLLGAGGVSLPEEATQDPAAYELYLKGRFAWHQRTEQGLREAVEYFGQAVARAPGYARAFVGLADAYAVSAFYDYRAPGEAYPKAEAAAQNALRIDPTLAAPHATLGYIRTYYDLDWPRAEEEFKRAIALDAGYSTAHQWYANLLTVAGRFSEAEREMRVAQEADPLSLIANAALGWTFYYAGRFEAALEQSRKTLALNPNFELAHLWGGWSLEAMGRREEARSWITEAVRLSHGSVLPRLALAYVLARSASPAAKDSARAIAQEIERFHAAGTYVPSYEVGKLHLALGDRSTALQWLERAYAERSHSRAFARVDPQLALLRGDPRWMRLIDGTGR